MVAEYNHWNEETKAFELALSLRDDAQVTLSDLTPEERKSFGSIVAALTARFEPEDQSELYRAEMKNRYRKRDEPLTELAQDIKRLVRLAYPDVGSTVRSVLARDAFEDSLGDPDMEWAVHQGKPKTVETALKLALEYEAFQGSRKKSIDARAPRGQLRAIEEAAFTDRSHITSNDRQNNYRGAPQNRPKICNFCGRRGHIERDCFIKKNLQTECTNMQPYQSRQQNQGNGH